MSFKEHDELAKVSSSRHVGGATLTPTSLSDAAVHELTRPVGVSGF